MRRSSVFTFLKGGEENVRPGGGGNPPSKKTLPILGAFEKEASARHKKVSEGDAAKEKSLCNKD